MNECDVDDDLDRVKKRGGGKGEIPQPSAQPSGSRTHDRSTVLVCVSLTVCVLNLQSDGDTVTDANPHLASCCELLELVLRKGLQRQHLP